MSYWTDKYFGSLYHEIYSQHLLDPQAALEEAAFASHVLDLGRRTIVDVACGFGRHARLLAQSNFVIAVDRAQEYLRAAGEDLPERPARNLKLARADMRDLPVRDGSLDAAVMLFNSFGYFGADDSELDVPEEAKPKQQVWKLPSVFYDRELVDTSFGRFKDVMDKAPARFSEGGESAGRQAAVSEDPNGFVLNEIYRVLKPGGGLLLEIANKRALLEAVEENPRRLMVLDEYEIHEEFEWRPDVSRLINRTRFVAGEREESAGYSLRLYEPAEIRELLGNAGLRVKRTFGDYEGNRFGPASSNILLLHALKPKRNRA